MTTYCLEIRSTQNWSDCRYRQYTTSKARTDRFKEFPKIHFSDSGHGLIPFVSIKERGKKRFPTISTLSSDVTKFLHGTNKE